MPPMLLNILQDYDNHPFSYNNDLPLSENEGVKKVYAVYFSNLIRNLSGDKIEDKNYTNNFVEREEKSDKWIDLYSKFKISFEQKKHLFPNVSAYRIESDFKKSLENILSCLPEILDVGVSDDECVYIYFEKNNKAVYFDLFFEPEQETEAAISVFENKVSKLSFTDYLDNAINQIRNKFITENELSCQTSTTI